MKKELVKSNEIQDIHRLTKNLLQKTVMDKQEIGELDERLKMVLAQMGQFKRYFRRLS